MTWIYCTKPLDTDSNITRKTCRVCTNLHCSSLFHIENSSSVLLYFLSHFALYLRAVVTASSVYVFCVFFFNAWSIGSKAHSTFSICCRSMQGEIEKLKVENDRLKLENTGSRAGSQASISSSPPPQTQTQGQSQGSGAQHALNLTTSESTSLGERHDPGHGAALPLHRLNLAELKMCGYQCKPHSAL